MKKLRIFITNIFSKNCFFYRFVHRFYLVVEDVLQHPQQSQWSIWTRIKRIKFYFWAFFFPGALCTIMTVVWPSILLPYYTWKGIKQMKIYVWYTVSQKSVQTNPYFTSYSTLIPKTCYIFSGAYCSNSSWSNEQKKIPIFLHNANFQKKISSDICEMSQKDGLWSKKVRRIIEHFSDWV